MAAEFLETLRDYADNPQGSLHLKGLSVGRFQVDEAAVFGREAAITLHEYILAALEFANRGKALRSGTRRPETLPMGTPARPLKTEIEDHLADMARRKLAPETIDATRRTLKLLLLTCGNIAVDRIDYKHIHQLWVLLRWAPLNLVSDPALRNLTYAEAVALGKKQGVPQIAPSTEERHRRFLVSFFNFLERARAIPSSPMDAFKKPERDYTVDPSKPVRLFDEVDLQKIFDPASFLPWAKKPHLWWLPMIGLYTGARVNEVAQLKLADVIQDGGKWCFAFRKTLDEDLAADPKKERRSRQSLKGKGSMRVVPLAQPLLDAGFLDYLADVKETGHPRLFPHLSAGTNKKTGETNARYSQAFVVDFGRYMKSLGFSKGIGFHAFRHTLATELDVHDIPDTEIALITGHATDQRDRVQVLRQHYLHKRPSATRAKQIKALECYRPGVELPVYQRGQFAGQFGKGAKVFP